MEQKTNRLLAFKNLLECEKIHKNEQAARNVC